MTSSGGMFPRFTSGPNLRTNHACDFFAGASTLEEFHQLAVVGVHLLGLTHDLRNVFHLSASFLRAGFCGAFGAGLGTTSPPPPVSSTGFVTLAI